MKVGIIGYAKPDIESLLQAYALRQFLKSNGIECFCPEDLSYMIEEENQGGKSEIKQSHLFRHPCFKISLQKTAKIQQLFIDEELKDFDIIPDINIYIATSQEESVPIDINHVKYIEFYQEKFKNKGTLLEPLMLLDKSEYELIKIPANIENDYIFLDCANTRSPLIRYAKKCARRRGYSVVSMIRERSFYQFEHVMEVYDPRQYLGLVGQAKMVITDTFLSTFFGILFQKEIAVRDDIRLAGKNIKFLSRLDMIEHYYRRKDFGYRSFEIKDKEWIADLLHTYQEKTKNHVLDLLDLQKKDRRVNCPTNILQNECCGCYACEAVCPVHAITMKKDGEGFYYPHVNDQCIHCNLCSSICIKKENIQIIDHETSYPKIYGAINRATDSRAVSSSGAIFPALAEYVIKKLNGVVFGVRFNENLVAETAMAETMDEVKKFYGSKYVKSELKGVCQKVKEQLEAGRYVLYSGLPCECGGLKAYLRKDYEKLFLCDILCHAAPSPDVFKDYIRYLNKKFQSRVKNVNFREKSKGWLLSQCRISFEFEDREPLVVNARKNNYFRSFLMNHIARPSCADCNYTGMQRVGDITIGDFWGVQELDVEMFDNKGASLIIVNNNRGELLWSKVKDGIWHKEKTIEEAFKWNHRKPMSLKKERDDFFLHFREEPINHLLYKHNDLRHKDQKENQVDK